MKNKPVLFHDFILVKHEKAKSKSGLILSSTATNMKSGVVAATSEGWYNMGILVPIPLNEGDEILWQGEGRTFQWEGEDFLLIKMSDVILKKIKNS